MHTHHTHFRSTDASLHHSTPGLIRGLLRLSSSPQSTFFRFPGAMHGPGSTWTNKRRRFQKSSVVDWMMPESEEWIRRKRRRRRSIDEQTSGCMVDLLNLSWAVLRGRRCGLSFFVLVDLGNEQSFVYYGGGGFQSKTPVGVDNVDSSMSIWWVYPQSASQHFFGSVVLQSSFSLSCTYALGEWSVVSHRWSRRTPAGFCMWSNQRGHFTECGRKNWTFTKSELLLHRHEANVPALAKQKLYAISMHCSWRTKVFCSRTKSHWFFFFDNELVVQYKYVFFFFFYKTPCISARLPWLMNVLCFCQG